MVTLFSAHFAATRSTDHARIEDYTLEGKIRGHHVYKTPVIGQILDVQAESSNGHDRYYYL